MLLAVVVAALPKDAVGCTCTETALQKLFNKAQTIFVAKIESVRIPKSWAELGAMEMTASYAPAPLDYYVVATSAVSETYKGRPDARGTVISLIHSPGACSPPLIPGLYLALFLDKYGFTTICHGSYPIGWNLDFPPMKAELDKLRALQSSAPQQPTPTPESRDELSKQRHDP